MMFWLVIASLAVVVLALARRRETREAPAHQLASEKYGRKGSKGRADVTASAPPIEPLAGFDLEQTKPKEFRPFKPIYHITMGLQASNPSELITMDQDYGEKMEFRRKTIASHPDTVVGAVQPDGLAPAQELYAYLLAEYLPTRYPSVFSLEDDGATLRNHVTGCVCPTAPPADVELLLRTLGETVEDDIFVLVRTPGGEHRMVAFVCCHPAGFDPAAKLGMVLAEIHGPVPSYEKIGPSMERFFAKLQVGEVVKRLNWAITTESQLFTPSAYHVHEGDEVQKDEEVDIEKTRLRVELQSLSRLPKTKAVIFSFKSYLYPVTDIKAEGLGPGLADAIEGLKKGNAPGMWTYKGAMRWGKAVCEYLRS
ncbi:hypothetical protein MCOR03_005118 [Pyricularia oryzae]|nr:hypothetical protein MCOR30_005859 [Pyricularia oryzae]KAI6558906.1 hypothetical protein MCOR03_005118 [Pyricularia oryzae]